MLVAMSMLLCPIHHHYCITKHDFTSSDCVPSWSKLLPLGIPLPLSYMHIIWYPNSDSINGLHRLWFCSLVSSLYPKCLWIVTGTCLCAYMACYVGLVRQRWVNRSFLVPHLFCQTVFNDFRYIVLIFIYFVQKVHPNIVHYSLINGST